MSADEFADLKSQKDDEECTDEEEIEKKLLEKKRRSNFREKLKRTAQYSNA